MRGSRAHAERSTSCGGLRPAFTLLEAVAAVCILGLLITGIIVAASRLTRQEGYTQRKREAIALADTLLAQWHAAGWKIPEPKEGQTGAAGQPGLRWSVRRTPEADDLPTGYGTYTLTVAMPDPGHPDRPVTLTEVAFLAVEPPKPKAGGQP